MVDRIVQLPASDIAALQRQARADEFIRTATVAETLAKAGVDEAEMQVGDLRALNGDVQVFRRVSAFAGDFPVLARVLRSIRRNVDDLSPLYERMSLHFFRTNKKLIFSQYAPGETPHFAPLKLNTLARKTPNTPILVQTGRLMMSLVGNNGPADISESINIITPRSLRVGTRVPYAEAHQEGYLDVPPRPPVQLGIGGRLQRWTEWAKQYALKLNIKDL